MAGEALAGVMEKWPEGEKVGRWTADEFSELLMDIESPDNIYYQKVCGLKAVVDKNASWAILKLYVKRMSRLAAASNKEETE